MKEVGFEPTTHGLKGRCGENDNDSNGNDLQQNSADDNPDFAKTPAILLQKYPELAQVVEAWERLPEHIKAAVITLVQTQK